MRLRPCRACSGRPTARRSSSRTAATGRREEGHRDAPARGRGAAAVHDHVEEALALLAQPKQRRGRGAPKPPLRELGPDPVSGKSWSPRRAVSAPTSPTARRTRAYVAATIRRPSRSSAPPSCSPSGARRPAPKRSRAAPGAPRRSRVIRPKVQTFGDDGVFFTRAHSDAPAPLRENRILPLDGIPETARRLGACDTPTGAVPPGSRKNRLWCVSL